MTKKIVVPEEMLAAAVDAMKAPPTVSKFRSTEQWASCGLEAALRWLSENPIVPTDEQVEHLKVGLNCYQTWNDQLWLICDAWQRRMFLAPELEVPEEISELCCQMDKYLNHTDGPSLAKDLLIEAYRRGQKAGQ